MMVMIMMMNHCVIVSVFLRALVRNNSNNVYYRSSSSRCPQTPPPHVGILGITASLVQNKHNNHPQPYDCPSRLTCLTASATGQLPVEGGKNDAAKNNNTPQHQPQSLLKAETTTPGFANSTTATTTGTGGPFLDRVQQLLAFRQKHGHCLVPKRYLENPALGNWVNKQRQEFKRFQSGKKPCALTPERIHLLGSIGMCWDAASATKHPSSTTLSSSSLSSTLDEHHEDDKDEEHEEDVWQEELREVINYMQVNNLTSVMDLPRQSSCYVWIKRQREKYGEIAVVVLLDDHHHQHPLGDDTKMMTTDTTSLRRIKQLSALDCDWYMTRRQAVWERRFRELKNYSLQHGDCCVPISYKASPQLAHWVSNQRKLYNQSRRRQKEKQDEQQHYQQSHHLQHQPPSITSTPNSQQHHGSTTTNGMTDERLARLQSLYFVWNRWDYEFAKKR